MTDQTPNPNEQQPGGATPPSQPPPPPAQPMASPPPPPAQPPAPQGQPYAPPHSQPTAPQGPPYTPPPSQPGPPQQAHATGGNASDLGNTVVLNYWLSVFFAWLPALIFYFTEKGKSQLSDQYHRENLNFSLIRTGAMIIAMFLIWIPVLGALIWFVAWAGGLVLHLLVAIKAKENFAAGREPGFLFNFEIVK